MIKQKEIARLSNISKSFICDILHLRRRPSAEIAQRLEQVTGIELRAWLMPNEYYNEMIADTMGPKYLLKKPNAKKMQKERRM